MAKAQPAGKNFDPHYAAPTGAGVDVSLPPQFGGQGPTSSVTGVEPAPHLGVVIDPKKQQSS